MLEGVRRREASALGLFFEHHFDRVYALAYRMLGSHAAAEDATQEVFLRVQRAADRLDPSRDSGPWIVTLALNVCRSTLRSAGARAATRTDPIDDVRDLAAPELDPEAARASELEHHAVREAIAMLPPALREVVVLRDFQRLEHPEIASLLGTSHEAVRKRYSRAIAELSTWLRGKLQ